jgi:RNA polymerase sigma factor (sigma-70 family)
MESEEFSKMLSGLISGKESSWALFIDTFYPLIRGKISKLAPHLDVDDITQEVYIQLINNDYRALKKVEGGFPSFLNFLVSLIENVVKSQSFKYFRNLNRHDENTNLETKADHRFSIEIEFTRREEESKFKDLIDKLDLTYLEVMQLRAKGYKAREIAKILNISQNTVLTKMKRGKEKLKILLGSEIKS